MPEFNISSEYYDIVMRLKGDMTVEEYLSRVIKNIDILPARYEAVQEDIADLRSSLAELDKAIKLVDMDISIPENYSLSKGHQSPGVPCPEKTKKCRSNTGTVNKKKGSTDLVRSKLSGKN